MTPLVHRAWRVRVDDIETTDFDIAFDIEKSTKREPNKCALKIWNLDKDRRRRLDALSATRRRDRSRIRVEIEAGYVEARGLIFRGDLRSAKSTTDGTDIVTTIEGEDGGRSALASRVNRSFPPGASIETVIRACAEAMGLGAGNVADVANTARFVDASRVFREGTTLSGSAATELEHVLRSVGLRYSIQNGVLQLQQRGRPLDAIAIELGPDSGLVGIPEANADGTLTARALLIPDLAPGRVVIFRDVDRAGSWRIERVKYQGDSFGNDWYAVLEVKAR